MPSPQITSAETQRHLPKLGELKKPANNSKSTGVVVKYLFAWMGSSIAAPRR